MSDPTVNPFSYLAEAQAVHATMDQALAAIPAGKRGALLAQAVTDQYGVTHEQLMVAARIGSNWQLAGGADWDGNLKDKASISVGVMGAW